MREFVTDAEAQTRLGDMLQRVSRGDEEFVIERDGKPLAVLVPVGRLRQIREAARINVRQFFQQQAEASPDELSEEDAVGLAREAQRQVREEMRRTGPPPTRSW